MLTPVYRREHFRESPKLTCLAGLRCNFCFTGQRFNGRCPDMATPAIRSTLADREYVSWDGRSESGDLVWRLK